MGAAISINLKSIPANTAWACSNSQFRTCTAFIYPNGTTENLIMIIPNLSSFTNTGVELYKINSVTTAGSPAHLYACKDVYWHYKNNAAGKFAPTDWVVTNTGFDYKSNRLLVGVERS